MQSSSTTSAATAQRSSALRSSDDPHAVGTNPRQPATVGYQIIRRNGAVVSFEPNKIAVAMMKAFLAVHGTQGAASASVREVVENLTDAVTRALMRSRPGAGPSISRTCRIRWSSA